jgi:hypothetical protein
MSENKITHEINLIGGYTVNGVTHRRVVFGKRLTAKKLLDLRLDAMSDVATQFQDLQVRDSIVEFGTLKMPVELTQLLALNTVDRDDLREGLDEFNKKYLAGRKAQIGADGKTATLISGVKIGDARYTTIEFGKDLTGYDEVAADKAGMTDMLARKTFLACRMVTKISNAEGSVIEGPLDYSVVNSDDVDEDDLFAFVGASELWRQSFRRRGRAVQERQDGANRAAAGDENKLDGREDSQPAAGEA